MLETLLNYIMHATFLRASSQVQCGTRVGWSLLIFLMLFVGVGQMNMNFLALLLLGAFCKPKSAKV